MSPDDDIGVHEAARAIVAGRLVDWASIESRTDLSDSLAALLRELRTLEGIAEFHRSLHDSAASSSLVGPGSRPSADDITLSAADGAAWGSLRLIEQVGRGAFGDVYRAWDPRLDREVALKLLRRPDSRTAPLASLVIDEGRLLARVRHPNVVTVYGADRINGRVGLWMEFVRGRTMEDILRDHGPFSAQESALIGLDLCRALSAVHRAGLIHRDVKAHNVLREGGGRVVLMDFGTGREDRDGEPAQLAGTPLYLAPEVFAGAAATPQSDIYSAGVLLYHLVTAAYPVPGATVEEIREAHTRRRRSWLRDDRPDLPERFIQAVERALEFDPALRYQSAGAMESALARIVSVTESPVSASVVGTLPSHAPRVRGSRRPWPAIGVAAAMAVAVALGAWQLPALWRARTPDGQGGVPAKPRTSASGESSVVVRKVVLPEFLLAGSPSPDATLFSFSDATGNVAVVDLATGAVRRITTDAVLERDSQFAEFSVISSDNRFVAYAWSALDGKYELRMVDFDGQRPRVLVRSDSIDYPIPLQWSRDGKFVLSTLVRSDGSVQLALVSAETGTIRTVKKLDEVRPQYASLSPDGEFVVYDAPQERSASSRDIFIVRADGTDDHRLIEHPANDANPVWTPDGAHVLFASDRSGTMDIWRIPVEGGLIHGQPQVMHRNMGRMSLRGLTDTGSYFYNADAGAVDVYQAHLDESGARRLEALPATYTGSNISSIWSPDGGRLAYASRRGLIGFDRGSTTLAVREMRSGQQHEVTPRLNDFLLRSWSPDGRQVLVGGSDAAGHAGIYAIDAESGRVTAIKVGDNLARPEWLADGRILYLERASGVLFARNAQTGAEERVADFRHEGIELLADVAGRGFRLGPDGQTLAYTALNPGTLARTLGVRVLGGGPPRELVQAVRPDYLQFQDWTPDGATLLFTRWTKASEPSTLWRVSIHGGPPQPMAISMLGLRDVSVHPDGTKITFTAGWPGSELWVMENFLAAHSEAK